MPFGDGTVPRGIGPMTGRGVGYCARCGKPGFANPAPTRRWFSPWLDRMGTAIKSWLVIVKVLIGSGKVMPTKNSRITKMQEVENVWREFYRTWSERRYGFRFPW